jgi:hypothetical protein
MLILLLCSVLLTSCISCAVYKKELTEGYELSANDDISGMSIFVNDGQYQVGVVNPTVFSVGFDEEFIIAKQHPFNDNLIDKSITNYYIVPVKDKVSVSPDENKIGPLSHKEFLVKRKELGVSEKLDFTITIDKLE